MRHLLFSLSWAGLGMSGRGKICRTAGAPVANGCSKETRRGAARVGKSNVRGADGSSLLILQSDMCQDPKKIRDPGSARSKIRDAQGYWILFFTFFVES